MWTNQTTLELERDRKERELELLEPKQATDKSLNFWLQKIEKKHGGK